MTAKDGPLKEQIQKALRGQRARPVTILSSLLAIQDELGYLPEEAIQAIADLLNSTINEVWGVASFYTNLRFTPPGRHQVEVCWGPSCHLVGARDVIAGVLAALSLQTEGDTSDGHVTLRYNTCLGACSQAPVIKVGDRVIGRVTAEQARALVARWR